MVLPVKRLTVGFVRLQLGETRERLRAVDAQRRLAADLGMMRLGHLNERT